MGKKGKRKNIYFRQTPKSFKADKHAQIFSHIKRGIPHTISKISSNRFNQRLRKIKKNIKGNNIGLFNLKKSNEKNNK
jgi:hypothetical protein